MSAMPLATEFASSPSGYVISVLVGILVALVGAQWRSQVKTTNDLAERQAAANLRIDQRFETVATALNETGRALAVVVAHDAEERPLVSAHGTQINELERTTSVLKETLDRHERWHERHSTGAGD